MRAKEKKDKPFEIKLRKSSKGALSRGQKNFIKTFTNFLWGMSPEVSCMLFALYFVIFHCLVSFMAKEHLSNLRLFLFE